MLVKTSNPMLMRSGSSLLRLHIRSINNNSQLFELQTSFQKCPKMRLSSRTETTLTLPIFVSTIVILETLI